MPMREGIYGLLAEFDTPGELVVAAKAAYDSGWRRMDCYTPYPVEEAAEAIGFHRNYVPLICLVGGLMGLAAMFLMETWVSVFAYPLNIAGTSALFLAGLRYPGLRVDHPVGGSFRRFRHAGHVRAAAALITRSSTLLIFATGPRWTSSFFAWKRTIPSSSWWNRAPFWKASGRFRWWRWSINPNANSSPNPGLLRAGSAVAG